MSCLGRSDDSDTDKALGMPGATLRRPALVGLEATEDEDILTRQGTDPGKEDDAVTAAFTLSMDG